MKNMTLNQRAKNVIYGYLCLLAAFFASTNKFISIDGNSLFLLSGISVLILILSLFFFIKGLRRNGTNLGSIFGVTGIIISGALLLLILSTSFIVGGLFKMIFIGRISAL